MKYADYIEAAKAVYKKYDLGTPWFSGGWTEHKDRKTFGSVQCGTPWFMPHYVGCTLFTLECGDDRGVLTLQLETENSTQRAVAAFSEIWKQWKEMAHKDTP